MGSRWRSRSRAAVTRTGPASAHLLRLLRSTPRPSPPLLCAAAPKPFKPVAPLPVASKPAAAAAKRSAVLAAHGRARGLNKGACEEETPTLYSFAPTKTTSSAPSVPMKPPVTTTPPRRTGRREWQQQRQHTRRSRDYPCHDGADQPLRLPNFCGEEGGRGQEARCEPRHRHPPRQQRRIASAILTLAKMRPRRKEAACWRRRPAAMARRRSTRRMMIGDGMAPRRRSQRSPSRSPLLTTRGPMLVRASARLCLCTIARRSTRRPRRRHRPPRRLRSRSRRRASLTSPSRRARTIRKDSAALCWRGPVSIARARQVCQRDGHLVVELPGCRRRPLLRPSTLQSKRRRRPPRRSAGSRSSASLARQDSLFDLEGPTSPGRVGRAADAARAVGGLAAGYAASLLSRASPRK